VNSSSGSSRSHGRGDKGGGDIAERRREAMVEEKRGERGQLGHTRERGGTTREWVWPARAPFLHRVRDTVENVEAELILR
jgi:hypothetical protein